MRSALLLACLLPFVPAPLAAAPPELALTLDFTAGEEAADQAFARLREHAGQSVRLRLTLVPRQEGEAGYLYSADGEDEDGGGLTCGQEGGYGIVDNLDEIYVVTFGHPADHHHMATIYVGERLEFPDQSLICGVENYTAQPRTSLVVSGTFQVEAAEVPTAFQYMLFPARP